MQGWKRVPMLVAIVGSAFFPLHASPRHDGLNHDADTSVYYYANRTGGWCVLKDHATFVREVEGGKAAEFETDEGRVWIKRGGIEKIEEYMTDVDDEWSTLSSYKFDRRGKVNEAKIVYRRYDLPSAKIYRFSVVNGTFRPEPSHFFSPKAFRAGTSAAQFPYLRLAAKLAASKSTRRLCA